MSKIRERFIHNSFSSYAVNILWYFISPYRKSYSSNHVILRLTENWKKYLDKNKMFGTVLMHLWKDFDGMPHDLLFAKLHAYGLSEDAMTFLYWYSKRRRQSVKINDRESFSNTFIWCTTRLHVRPNVIQYFHKWLIFID